LAQNFSISGDFPTIPAINTDNIKNAVTDKAKDIANAAGVV
jgi:hypothetical protein